MRQFVAICSAIFFLVGASSPSAARAVRDCPPLATDPIGMTVEEVAEQSSDIVLAVAQNFTSPDEMPSNLGFYEFDIGRTIKGDLAIDRLEVLGFQPYSTVPQHYIDATTLHESNGNRYKPTEFNKVKIGRACHLAFKGLRGYSYLLFFKGDELWGFNVINNTQRDVLLRQVETTQQQD